MRKTLCSVSVLGALPAVALLVATGQLRAGTVQVPADFTTIQAAIDAALNGDTILVAPGLYHETIDLQGKAVTLRSADGPQSTILDGSVSARAGTSVVTIGHDEGPDTVFEGFTITGGHADEGGGMYIEGSSPTIRDCVFIGNSSNLGGGGLLCIDHSHPQIIDCVFQQNTAGAGGGGALCAVTSSPTFMGCQFIENSALGDGGGFSCAGQSSWPQITNCTFVNNTAAVGGGGMMVFLAKPTVGNSLFEGNSAKVAGGVYLGGTGAYGTFENCVVTGNVSASDGGGFTLFNCVGIITNCLIANNQAAAFSGGIHIDYSVGAWIKDCTIAGNVAAAGGGMACESFEGEAPNYVAVANCVFRNDGEEVVIRDSSTVEISYSNVEGGWPGTGNIDADPKFLDAGSADFRLSPGSPCIDAGDSSAVPNGIEIDLDGNPRFHDDPGTPDSGLGDPPVDMGAYEFQGASCIYDCEAVPDGSVGVTDFLALLAEWGGPGSCDFDGAGVGVTDFLNLLSNWGPCP